MHLGGILLCNQPRIFAHCTKCFAYHASAVYSTFTQYIEEITEGADKQLKIELGLAEITEKWAGESFIFSEWKGRGINVLKSTGTIVEELEEAQVCTPVLVVLFLHEVCLLRSLSLTLACVCNHAHVLHSAWSDLIVTSISSTNAVDCV